MTVRNGQRDDQEARMPILDQSAWRQLFIVFALFAAIDVAIRLICPRYGGDCLYGFLTLIAFPVMLSGPLGMLSPRYAMRRSGDWRVRLLIFALGGALLLAVVTGCHIVAIRFFNGFDYGEVLLKRRLLGIELVLSLAYYVVLGLIAFIKAPAPDL